MPAFLPGESTIGNYILIRQIGSGAFADVWEAVNKINKLTVAIKIIKKSNISTTDSIVRFQREIAILKKIDHPFISQFFEFLDDATYYYIVIEYAANGNLLDFVNLNGRMSDIQARRYFSQLISALEYLHETLHIAHRDLKAENVLLDRHNNIKIIDFGLSNQFNMETGLLQTACGSPAYAAPEMIKGRPYSKAADIWSAGVLLFAIVVGELPFDDVEMQKLLQKIIFKKVKYPSFIAPALVDLLKKMLCKNPESRITLDKIKSHYWFSQIEYESSFHFMKTTQEEDGTIDVEIVQAMNAMGVDTTTLAQSLIMGDFNPTCAIYREIARDKLIDKMSNLREIKRITPHLPEHRTNVAFALQDGRVAPIGRAITPIGIPRQGCAPPMSKPLGHRVLTIPAPIPGNRRMSRPVAVRRPAYIPKGTQQSYDT